MRAFLIQGLFFQVREGLGINYVPGGEGPVVVIQRGLTQNMFSGAIWEEGGDLVGRMDDGLGEAILLGIDLIEEADGSGQLTFEKTYVNSDGQARRPPISYAFKKDRKKKDGIWIGGYQSPKVGRGWANCILTPVDPNFFTQGRIVEFFEGISPFDPVPLFPR